MKKMNGVANNGLSDLIRRVPEFNEELDIREKMSLVFLMCDDALKAHCLLKANIDDSLEQNKILPELFFYLENSDRLNVYAQFVESLILIGNNKLVISLGYSKSEVEKLKKMFKIQNKKCFINFARKSLHKMCEKMSEEELAVLIGLIENEFKERKCHFTHHPAMQMELNLLYWICEGYLFDGIGNKGCDVSNLMKHLQKMNRHDLVKELENIHVSNYNSLEEAYDLLYPDNDFLESSCPIAALKTLIPSVEDRYEMDQSNMGLCIIVNQRNYVKLCQVEGNVRHGTDHDRDMLDITFSGLGYKVIVLENLGSDVLQQHIRKIVHDEVHSSHSSLILCILSHGIRDTILCVDGVGVPVEDIENLVTGEECPQLLGKPKIIIIQACQGSIVQRAMSYPQNQLTDVDDSSMLESDGPSKAVVPLAIPPKADLFTFWATVPGYMSFRSHTSGSIFIQTLCAELLKRGNYDHFNNIVTHVNDKITKKHFDEDKKVTVPYVKHTATKNLFFPYSSQCRCKAAERLYERYLIDTLIKHCIIKVALWKIKKNEK